MEPATAADHEFILEKVREYEGEQSAEIAHYWLRKRPEAFIMFHTAAERRFGFGCCFDAGGDYGMRMPTWTRLWELPEIFCGRTCRSVRASC